MNTPSVTILDPGSLLGEELVPRLSADAPWISQRYFHSQDSGDHLILQVGERPSVVAPLADTSELADTELVVLTENPSPEARKKLLSFLASHPELPCLDLSRPGVLPGPRGLWPLAGERRLLFPDPMLLLPALLLRAVAPLEPQRAWFSVLSPVSPWGDKAFDELAAQAVARLSGQQAKRRVLPEVLAFAALPYPEQHPGQLRGELEAMFPGVAINVHPVLAGLFHGHALLATLTVSHGASPAQLRKLLSNEGFALQSGRKAPTSTHVTGQAQPIAWPLSVEKNSVTLWIVGDHLTVQAQTASQAICQLLSTFH